MQAVGEVIAYLYKFLAVLPFIPFALVYWIAVRRGREKQAAVRLAMDITNLFLVGIVASRLNDRMDSGFGLYLILLFMLICAGLIGGAQNRKRGKIDPFKIFRAVWRLSFFALAVLYVLLMSLELVLPSA
jgi:hypothetical protein